MESYFLSCSITEGLSPSREIIVCHHWRIIHNKQRTITYNVSSLKDYPQYMGKYHVSCSIMEGLSKHMADYHASCSLLGDDPWHVDLSRSFCQFIHCLLYDKSVPDVPTIKCSLRENGTNNTKCTSNLPCYISLMIQFNIATKHIRMYSAILVISKSQWLLIMSLIN